MSEATIPKKTDHCCPHRREIERVRAWQAQGLDELVVVHRRRDRLSLALAGAALTITLALSSGGWSLARQLGRLEASLEGLEERLGERLDGIERRMDRTEDRRD
jgi:hypothetical protein